MAKEHYIRGKQDASHHVGRFSNEKAKQEAQQALNDLFFDLYGIPLSWAKSLAHLSFTEWQERLDAFEELLTKPVEEGEIDVT